MLWCHIDMQWAELSEKRPSSVFTGNSSSSVRMVAMAQGTDKFAPRQEVEARKRTQRSDFARTNAGEQGVDSLRIGREGALGLAVATGGSAGLLHQSPRACRRLLSLFSFHLQIHGKRKWTRGDLNP